MCCMTRPLLPDATNYSIGTARTEDEKKAGLTPAFLANALDQKRYNRLPLTKFTLTVPLMPSLT